MKEAIIKLIKERKVKQTQLSAWTGLDVRSVGRVLRGESRMTVDFAEAVCSGLGVSVLLVPKEHINSF